MNLGAEMAKRKQLTKRQGTVPRTVAPATSKQVLFIDPPPLDAPCQIKAADSGEGFLVKSMSSKAFLKLQGSVASFAAIVVFVRGGTHRAQHLRDAFLAVHHARRIFSLVPTVVVFLANDRSEVRDDFTKIGCRVVRSFDCLRNIVQELGVETVLIVELGGISSIRLFSTGTLEFTIAGRSVRSRITGPILRALIALSSTDRFFSNAELSMAIQCDEKHVKIEMARLRQKMAVLASEIGAELPLNAYILNARGIGYKLQRKKDHSVRCGLYAGSSRPDTKRLGDRTRVPSESRVDA